MGFFKKDKEIEKDGATTKEAEKSVSSKKKESTPDSSKSATANGDVLSAVIRPWITEKTHGMVGDDKYAFKVSAEASKGKIKRAVKEMYGVDVEGVNVINIKPKKRYFGRKVGMKSGYRKAIVTLKKGDKIEFFQGV